MKNIVLKWLLFMSSTVMFSQDFSIAMPELIFTNACASSAFNSFGIKFIFSPPQKLEPGNRFIVEMSDATGDFSNPLEVGSSEEIRSPVTIMFKVPDNSSGENYKVRVRSTAPVATSKPSKSFAAHILMHNKPFTINDTKPQASICGEQESYVLKIDDTGTESSPVFYPYLTYKWFRDGEWIKGEKGSSITVTESGVYRVHTDYGSCESLSSSHEVKVTKVGNMNVEIGSSDPVLCESKPSVLSSNVSEGSYKYQWYLGGNEISGATDKEYSTTTEGVYKLFVKVGTCEFSSNEIDLKAAKIEASINIPEKSILLPGDTKEIIVKTDASMPEYQWYRGEILIQDEKGTSIVVNTPGKYKVIVTQTDGCKLVKELVATIEKPEKFEANVKTDDQYQGACKSMSAVLSIDQLLAVTSSGEKIDILNKLEDISFQWYKDGGEVMGATINKLEITDLSKNGDYKLQVNIPEFSNVDSNVLNIKLTFAGDVVIDSDETLCDNNLTVKISSNIENISYTTTGYTYRWYKEGSSDVIGTENDLEVDTPGVYRLDVEQNGCVKSSNNYSVFLFDASQVIVNAPERITLVNGASRTITATGAHDYTWYKDDKVVSTAAHLTINDEGIYILKATIGDCEVTKQFTVTLVENTSVIVPNVISPNGDGINDTWNLPNEYAYQNTVEVVIIGSGGKILFRQNDYQNDWPQGVSNFLNEPIVYYLIIKDGKVVKQGSITILK